MNLNNEEAFRNFDKGLKGYLTKHEFKCAIIYLTGVKLRYDLLKSIWADKDKFYQENKERSKGISLKYFKHVLQSRKEIYPVQEQRLELEFQSIDIQRRGKIDFNQFNALFESFDIKYMNEKIRESIFHKLDLDKDGYITLQDYLGLMHED